MYRQIFMPTERDSSIPLVIPPEWYGQAVEVIAFPINVQNGESVNLLHQETELERRKNLNSEFDRYLIDLSGFKFNRDEANHYD